MTSQKPEGWGRAFLPWADRRVDGWMERENRSQDRGRGGEQGRASGFRCLHICRLSPAYFCYLKGSGPTDAPLQAFGFPGCVSGRVAPPATTRGGKRVQLCCFFAFFPPKCGLNWSGNSSRKEELGSEPQLTYCWLTFSDCSARKTDLYRD